MAVKKVLDESSLSAIKSYVDKNGIPTLSTLSTVAGSGSSSSYKSVRWYVSGVDGVTAPYDGMKVAIKVPLAGVSTAGVVFSLNGDTDADYHPVAYNVNTVLTTHYPVNTYKIFVYDASATMTCYITAKTAVTITGVWKGESNYDSNTTTTYGTLDYYFRPYNGANVLTRYKLVALDKDNRVVPLTLEQYIGDYSSSTSYAKDEVVTVSGVFYKSLVASNKNHAPASSASYWTAITPYTPTSVAFKPNKIYFYNTTTKISASAVIGGQTLTEIGYSTSVPTYNFNGGIVAYRVIYLCGTYDKTTGLFTLDTTNNTSYYTIVPDNTANITLSSYFTSGKDYILVGATYSSANYFQLFMVNTMYHFDGTNLIPYDTWNAEQHTGTITGVSVNGTSVATSGVANITDIPWSIVSGAPTIPTVYVTTVNGDSGAITNVAKTNASNSFSQKQTIGPSTPSSSTEVLDVGKTSSYGGGFTFYSGYAGGPGYVTGNFNSSSSSYPEIKDIKDIVFHQGYGGTHSADTYTTTLVSSSQPTANRTITLPDASGEVLLSGTISLDSQDSSGTGMVSYVSSVSGGGASGSGTTKYLHFSAGSTPSRESFNYATGAFTTAASMNFNTGSTSDNKYVYEISSTGASASGTATFVKSINGGSGSFTPTTKYLSASFSGSSATTSSPTGSTTVATHGHTHSVTASGSVTLTANDSTSTGRITYVQSISGGSGDLTSNDTASGGIAYVASASHTAASLGTASTGTVTISGGSYSGTTRYMKVTPTAASTGTVGISGGSGTFYGTRSTSGSGTTARRTLTLSHSHTAASLTGTKTFVTSAISAVTLSASETSTDGPAYVQSISGSAPSLGGTKTFVTGYPDFSGGSATHTTKYLHHTHTGASATTKYLSASFSGSAVTSGSDSGDGPTNWAP